jgi:hypothetical protein
VSSIEVKSSFFGWYEIRYNLRFIRYIAANRPLRANKVSNPGIGAGVADGGGVAGSGVSVAVNGGV